MAIDASQSQGITNPEGRARRLLGTWADHTALSRPCVPTGPQTALAQVQAKLDDGWRANMGFLPNGGPAGASQGPPSG